MKEETITIDGHPLNEAESAAVRYAINNLIDGLNEGEFEGSLEKQRRIMRAAMKVHFFIRSERTR